MQQVHGSDPPEMITDGYVIAGAAALYCLQHDSCHDVADQRRGRQCNGCADHDAVKTEQLPAKFTIERQEQDQCEDGKKDTAELYELQPKGHVGLAFEVLDEPLVGEVSYQRNHDDRDDGPDNDHQVFHGIPWFFRPIIDTISRT
ncbi:MAG: hypothetical protein P8X53_14635, partial [Chromatiales bacterium]